MKIGLANDENTVAPQPTVAEHIGAAASVVKSFLGRFAQPRKSEAWLSGYNAFYEGVSANPHAPDTEAWKEWNLGSKAFEQDFEW
ncbi:hypothetical protein [Massilia sp. SYSU DXS3249]